MWSFCSVLVYLAYNHFTLAMQHLSDTRLFCKNKQANLKQDKFRILKIKTKMCFK